MTSADPLLSDLLGSFFVGEKVMNQEEAVKKLTELIRNYQDLESPKNQQLSLKEWEEMNKTLKKIKPLLKDNSDFSKLLNAVSQFISKLKKLGRIQPIKRAKNEDGINPDILMNTSERGVNKSVPCIRNKKDFPFKWEDEKTGIECSIKNGIWGASNYMLMDIFSYMFLMTIGNNIFPEDLDPTFKSGNEIVDRESELKSISGQTEIIHTDNTMQLKIEMIKKNDSYIVFDDKKFRELTGKKLSSNSIRDLIYRTSSTDFQLVFPVRMLDEG